MVCRWPNREWGLPSLNGIYSPRRDLRRAAAIACNLPRGRYQKRIPDRLKSVGLLDMTYTKWPEMPVMQHAAAQKLALAVAAFEPPNQEAAPAVGILDRQLPACRPSVVLRPLQAAGAAPATAAVVPRPAATACRADAAAPRASAGTTPATTTTAPTASAPPLPPPKGRWADLAARVLSSGGAIKPSLRRLRAESMSEQSVSELSAIFPGLRAPKIIDDGKNGTGRPSSAAIDTQRPNLPQQMPQDLGC